MPMQMLSVPACIAADVTSSEGMYPSSTKWCSVVQTDRKPRCSNSTTWSSALGVPLLPAPIVAGDGLAADQPESRARSPGEPAPRGCQLVNGDGELQALSMGLEDVERLDVDAAVGPAAWSARRVTQWYREATVVRTSSLLAHQSRLFQTLAAAAASSTIIRTWPSSEKPKAASASTWTPAASSRSCKRANIPGRFASRMVNSVTRRSLRRACRRLASLGAVDCAPHRLDHVGRRLAGQRPPIASGGSSIWKVQASAAWLKPTITRSPYASSSSASAAPQPDALLGHQPQRRADGSKKAC